MAQHKQPRINYIRQIKGFWEKVGSEDRLKSSSMGVYFALLERCNLRDWKEEFTVDYEIIMDLCSISKNTYYDCIKNLVEKGYITHTRQENRALLSRISIIVLYQNLVHEQDTSCDSNSDTDSDTSCDSSSTLIKHTKPNKPLKLINIPFDTFFNLYPVKVGKKESEKKWDNLSDAQRQEIIDMLPKYIAYQQFPGWNHPNPSTFLNKEKERWKDDLTIPQNRTHTTDYPKKRVLDHSKLL